uniref:Uncharacterized protein n=1 Tax=Romanomermis culicivorax TaxID=13658 RepID=A0A915IVK5_ROMCU
MSSLKSEARKCDGASNRLNDHTCRTLETALTTLDAEMRTISDSESKGTFVVRLMRSLAEANGKELEISWRIEQNLKFK